MAKVVKVGSKICQILNKPSKNCQNGNKSDHSGDGECIELEQKDTFQSKR